MMDQHLAVFYNMHYQQAVNSLKLQSGHVASMELAKQLGDQRFGSNIPKNADIGDRSATNSNKGLYL